MFTLLIIHEISIFPLTYRQNTEKRMEFVDCLCTDLPCLDSIYITIELLDNLVYHMTLLLSNK